VNLRTPGDPRVEPRRLASRDTASWLPLVFLSNSFSLLLHAACSTKSLRCTCT
jgi:hypothetical protein